MKKRICTLLLALCLTLGLLPAAAQAAGDGSGTFDTVRWTLDADGGLTVSGTATCRTARSPAAPTSSP